MTTSIGKAFVLAFSLLCFTSISFAGMSDKRGINDISTAVPAPKESTTSSEEDLLVKMPRMPSKLVRWGMSVDELKNEVEDVFCEKDDSGISCEYSSGIGLNLLSVTFSFEGGMLTSIASMMPIPKSNPGELDKRIAELQQATGNNPQRHENEEGVYYETYLEFSRCKSSVRKRANIDFFHTFCTPDSYIYAYIKPPAKEPFKLLDLTFGKSTQEEIIAASKANNWMHTINFFKRETTISLYGTQIDGVLQIRLNLFDNKLKAVEYVIDEKFSDKGAFYKLLTSKYGKHVEDQKTKTYYVWEVNPATRDNVSIIMSFNGNPENVTSIAYSLEWLAQKEVNIRLAKIRKESTKKKDLKSKAF